MSIFSIRQGRHNRNFSKLSHFGTHRIAQRTRNKGVVENVEVGSSVVDKAAIIETSSKTT